MNDHFPINHTDRMLPSVNLPYSVHRTTSQEHKNTRSLGRITYNNSVCNSGRRGWTLSEGRMTPSPIDVGGGRVSSDLSQLLYEHAMATVLRAQQSTTLPYLALSNQNIVQLSSIKAETGEKMLCVY